MDVEKIRKLAKEIQKITSRPYATIDDHTAKRIEKAAKDIENELPKLPPCEPFNWDAVG